MGYSLPRAPTRSFDREESEKEMHARGALALICAVSGSGGMKNRVW